MKSCLWLLLALLGLAGCATNESVTAPPTTATRDKLTLPTLLLPASTVAWETASECGLLGRWIVDRDASTELLLNADALVLSPYGRACIETGSEIDRGAWRIEDDGSMRLSGLGKSTVVYAFVVDGGVLALSSSPKTMVVLRAQKILVPSPVTSTMGQPQIPEIRD
ncbi:MAG: hypothetical protein EXS00_03545 [Phycisphaerales bacterium]|nr:hypothetical protein [Phycisphaerales bacterium]